jgi:cytoskeletal protein CcmA (bactofilin family)
MKNKRIYKWFSLISVFMLLVTIFALQPATPVHAAEFIEEGTIPAGQIIDDDVFLTGGPDITMLFASSENVTINGTVNGDAVLLGNHIIISEKANITGNVFTGGAIIEVKGTVGGSIFGGSSSIIIDQTAKTNRNVFYGGYSFETRGGSVVNRDLYAAVYQAILAGDVGRNATVAAGAIELSGKVNQNARFEVGDPGEDANPAFPGFLPPGSPTPIRPGLRISDSAKIGGQLTYKSSTNQSSSIKSQPSGGTVFITPVPDQTNVERQRASSPSGQALSAAFGFIRDLVTLLILGGLALWLIPIFFKKTVTFAQQKALPAAGYGIVTIIIGYLAVFLSFILVILAGLLFSAVSLGGLSSVVFGVGFSTLTLVSVIFTFLVSLGSKLVVAYLVGSLIINKTAPQTTNPNLWSLVCGAAIYAFLHNIPVLGWIVGFISAIIGVGAVWMLYKSVYKPVQQGLPAEITQ